YSPPVGRARRTALHVPDRPHVHEPVLADRHLLRPFERLVLRGALDQVKAAEPFLRLRERSVGDVMMTRLHAHARGLVFRTQALGCDRFAGLLYLLGEPHEGLERRLALGRGGRRCVLVMASDEQQIAHSASLTLGCYEPLTHYDADGPLGSTGSEAALDVRGLALPQLSPLLARAMSCGISDSRVGLVERAERVAERRER